MLYLPHPRKVPVSFLLHWRCLWHLLHPRGVHATSPSPLESPCGTFTSEVSVPQLQHLHHPGDLCCVPGALGGSLQHLHHPGGACAASPPSHGGPCSISITLEVPLPNLHHPGGVHVPSPSPPMVSTLHIPIPLGGPSRIADAGPPGDLSSTHNIGWTPILLVPHPTVNGSFPSTVPARVPPVAPASLTPRRPSLVTKLCQR